MPTLLLSTSVPSSLPSFSPGSTASIPLASHQSLLPSTTIGTPQSFSPAESSTIEHTYDTITAAAKAWGQAVRSNFFDLFSRLRETACSYTLWHEIYLNF